MLRARHMLSIRSLSVFSFLVLLTSCELFEPPFTFDNIHDPLRELQRQNIVARPLFSRGGGFTEINRFAVGADGFVLSRNSLQGYLTRYDFDTGSYSILPGNDAFDERYVYDVALSPDNEYAYAGTRDRIMRYNFDSGQAEPEWVVREGFSMRSLFVTPDGAIWVAAESHGDSNLHFFRYSASGIEEFARSYAQDISHHPWDWHVAVSPGRIALSRHNDVLFFDRSSGNYEERLLHDTGGTYITETDLPAQPADTGVAFNAVSYVPGSGQFIASGSFDTGTGFDVLMYIAPEPASEAGTAVDEGSLSPEATGNRGVTVAGNTVYLSFTDEGLLYRLDGVDTLVERHRNGEDPLGFDSIRELTVDPFDGPDGTLYLVDHRYSQSVKNLDVASADTGSPVAGAFPVTGVRSLQFTESGVYALADDRLEQFSRAGTLLETLLTGIAGDSQQFVASAADDRVIIRQFFDDQQTRILVYEYTSGNLVNDQFVPDSDARLFATTSDIFLLNRNSASEISIQRFDASQNEFSVVGSIPMNELVRDEQADMYHDSRITGVTATPSEWFWILSTNGIAVLANTQGEVFRTIQLEHEWGTEAAALSAGGSLFFGLRDGVVMYGSR